MQEIETEEYLRNMASTDEGYKTNRAYRSPYTPATTKSQAETSYDFSRTRRTCSLILSLSDVGAVPVSVPRQARMESSTPSTENLKVQVIQ